MSDDGRDSGGPLWSGRSGDEDRDPFGRPAAKTEPDAAPAARPVPELDTSRDWSQSPGPDLDTSRDWSQPPEPGDKPGRDWRAWGKRVGGPIGFFVVLLSKAALLLKIPLLGTVITGAISIVAYAWLYGYPFAFWLVTSLMVHELGHAIQVKREGLKLKALNFVPFLGAYVMHEGTTDPARQARISIAGPIAGALFAAVIYLFAGDSRLLLAVAYTGFFLNLLNLLPVAILDGAGVGRVFTAAWWLVVGIALVAISFASGSVFAALVGLMCLIHAYTHRAEGWLLDPPPGIARRDAQNMAVLFICVSAVCAFGMAASYEDRSSEIVRAPTTPAMVAPTA
jgi:Zn-dependent protease